MAFTHVCTHASVYACIHMCAASTSTGEHIQTRPERKQNFTFVLSVTKTDLPLHGGGDSLLLLKAKARGIESLPATPGIQPALRYQT